MKTENIKVVVGSLNPVKINAAKQAIMQFFELEQLDCLGINAPSNVAAQPMSAAETRLGAINRLSYCQLHHQADYYVAIEGGADKLEDGPVTFAYIAIADQQRMSVGRSAMLPLPPIVYQALAAGEELGPVMDRLFNTHNIKQKGGAIGLLTRGLATREGNYTQAITLALAPFLHPELFPNDNT
ncbi:inosine/xanthosine triphosphatase [Flavobacterium sp. W21_SRS_FM6]|uniref:inosine/xanthosine triphosphatase n=1 Tax=Flavobacterium sp. W21_SRS_FM6 TaxID=3240268 RepID=UPI003F8E3B2A